MNKIRDISYIRQSGVETKRDEDLSQAYIIKNTSNPWSKWLQQGTPQLY